MDDHSKPSRGPAERSDRFDSWKEIAAYLNRDVRTVQRWEKHAGLPVYRVGSAKLGRVYAYRQALDAWLAAGAGANGAEPSPRRLPHWHRWTWPAAGVTVAAIVALVAWQIARPPLSADGLRVHVTTAGVSGIDAAGVERWRYAFPTEHKFALSELANPAQVVAGVRPAVYVAIAHRNTRDGSHVAGELMELDLQGRRQRSFSFDEEIVREGKTFGPPWSVDAFAVDDTGGRRRIAVSGHHMLWAPSLVTLLDDQWRRTATFVHHGWLEYLYWVGQDRLVAGGFSEEQQGGVVALLNPDALAAGPLRLVVMRRSEVNRVSGSRFNRAIVQSMPDRIVARTIEVPSTGQEGVDALYEFTPSLELISASYSDRYWDTHRALELADKLDHTRDGCPDREGPPAVVIWEPATGWTTHALRSNTLSP